MTATVAIRGLLRTTRTASQRSCEIVLVRLTCVVRLLGYWNSQPAPAPSASRENGGQRPLFVGQRALPRGWLGPPYGSERPASFAPRIRLLPRSIAPRSSHFRQRRRRGLLLPTTTIETRDRHTNGPGARSGPWGGASSNTLPIGMTASGKPSSISNSIARRRTRSSAYRMKGPRLSMDSSRRRETAPLTPAPVSILIRRQ
jgi:hypothetical protein